MGLCSVSSTHKSIHISMSVKEVFKFPLAGVSVEITTSHPLLLSFFSFIHQWPL